MKPIDQWLDEGKAEFLATHRRKAKAPKEAAPKRGNPERDAQRAVVGWLRKAGCIVNAAVNEQAARSNDPGERARFGAARKASGVTSGFPDLTVITPGGRIAFVEMKSAVGKLSEAQRELHADMLRRGVVVITGRDIWSVQDGLARAGVEVRAPRWQPAMPVSPL